jgi:hypothetical protein
MWSSYKPFSGESFVLIESHLSSERTPSRFAGLQTHMIREFTRVFSELQAETVKAIKIEVKPDGKLKAGRSVTSKFVKKSSVVEVKVHAAADEVLALGQDEQFDFLLTVYKEAIAEGFQRAVETEPDLDRDAFESNLVAALTSIERSRVIIEPQPIEAVRGFAKGFFDKLKEEFKEKKK